MPDRAAASVHDVFYYRGRFWAAVAWSNVNPERTVETAALPRKGLDGETNRSHSASTNPITSRRTVDQYEEKSPLTTEEQELIYESNEGEVAMPNRTGLIVWGMVMVVLCVMAIAVVKARV